MSSAKERLEKARGNSFLVGLAAGASTPKQLDKAVENLRELGIKLTEEERKEAREIALKKRDDKKTFKAILSEVLKKEKIKESKMTLKDLADLTEEQRKAVEIVKGLPKKIRKKALRVRLEEESLEKCGDGYCGVNPRTKKIWRTLCWSAGLIAGGMVISVGFIFLFPGHGFYIALTIYGIGLWIWLGISSDIIYPCPSRITKKYCQYYKESNKK